MRLNRLQLRRLQLRRSHRLPQLRPRQLQVTLRRDQFLFALGHVDLGRHLVRLHSKSSLDVLRN
jgi:hypothetical protein